MVSSAGKGCACNPSAQMPLASGELPSLQKGTKLVSFGNLDNCSGACCERSGSDLDLSYLENVFKLVCF